jgi:hypothetical protein
VCFLAQNGRKVTGKNPKNFRPEYCFHVPSISEVFLPNPVTRDVSRCFNRRRRLENFKFFCLSAAAAATKLSGFGGGG